MEKLQNCLQSARVKLLLLAVLVLIAGGFYYLLFRWQGHALASEWPWLANYRLGLSDPTNGAAPSLLHMLALGCLSTALLGIRRGAKLILVLFLATVVAERAFGVFDWTDLWFAALGALLAIGLAAKIFSSSGDQSLSVPQLSRRQIAMVSASLVACSGLFVGASYGCLLCSDGTYSPTKPIYLSYSELRNSVSIEGPRELSEIGRIYLYREFIFLNKRNQGIHVLDNSDPENPVNRLFISVPGNTELSIRDNYLYADSYVDLVTLDLNDPANIQPINRQIDIFPWDEYQNVPDNIYFDYSDIDPNRGVIVSYER